MFQEKKFVPVMITPFNLKRELDFSAINGLIDFYLCAGAKALFANCLSSEMYSITEEERIKLTKYIVKYVDGRVPVVATGSFGLTTKDKVEFTKRIYDTGIDAVVLVTSHYAKVNDEDNVLVQNFDRMFSLTGNIPLGLYECPVPYKRVLSPDVFKSLVDTGRVIYYKDTSIERKKIMAKLDVINNNKKIEFYDAHTPNALFSVGQGAKGMSSISGNFYPEVMVWLCENAINPEKQKEAEWIQKQLTKADPLIHQAYPMSAKYFLQKRGLPIQQISRTHVLQLTPQEIYTLDTIFNSFSDWCEELNIPMIKDKLVR